MEFSDQEDIEDFTKSASMGEKSRCPPAQVVVFEEAMMSFSRCFERGERGFSRLIRLSAGVNRFAVCSR